MKKSLRTSATPPERETLFPTAILFDLDGTLIDSVYQHVLAWREALEQTGIHLAVWRIHRRIGMSGGLLVNALARETEGRLSAAEVKKIQDLHTENFKKFAADVRLLPGAKELLQTLNNKGVPYAVATSGWSRYASSGLDLLQLPANVPVITRDEVEHAKPDPDLFLRAADRLDIPIEHCIVVGDSIWDMLAARRARGLAVGVLSGGYGQEELERAGAYRVYQDPADLLLHLDEIGVRPG